MAYMYGGGNGNAVQSGIDELVRTVQQQNEEKQGNIWEREIPFAPAKTARIHEIKPAAEKAMEEVLKEEEEQQKALTSVEEQKPVIEEKREDIKEEDLYTAHPREVEKTAMLFFHRMNEILERPDKVRDTYNHGYHEGNKEGYDKGFADGYEKALLDVFHEWNKIFPAKR